MNTMETLDQFNETKGKGVKDLTAEKLDNIILLLTEQKDLLDDIFERLQELGLNSGDGFSIEE